MERLQSFPPSPSHGCTKVELTLNRHQVQTKVKITKGSIKIAEGMQTADLLIIADQLKPYIDSRLNSSIYDDPLTIWKNSTFQHQSQSSEELQLMAFIKSGWDEKCIQDVARFVLFAKMPKGERYGPLKLTFKGRDVRNDKTLFDIHAHSPATEALYHFITTDPDLKTSLEGIVAIHHGLLSKDPANHSDQGSNIKQSLMSNEKVKKFIATLNQKDLPTSFLYPTIGVKLEFLPYPNQFCTESVHNHVAYTNSNSTHIRFSRRGIPKREVDGEVLMELIGLSKQSMAVARC